jgi:hypothetical protein
MTQPQILRVVIASSGDAQAERRCLEAVTEELNRGVAAVLGLRLEIVGWETYAFPGFHIEGPQDLIDSRLRIEVEDCDVFIGIFWKRFGTPLGGMQSDTEHAFRIAYGAWRTRGRPHIMVYFNQKPYAPTAKAEIDQWNQVMLFKENFPEEGLWWPYNGKDEFERLVRHHLTQWICQRGAPVSLLMQTLNEGECVRLWSFKNSKFEPPMLWDPVVCLTDANTRMWEICRKVDKHCERSVIEFSDLWRVKHFTIKFLSEKFEIISEVERFTWIRTCPYQVLFTIRASDPRLVGSIVDEFTLSFPKVRIIRGS